MPNHAWMLCRSAIFTEPKSLQHRHSADLSGKPHNSSDHFWLDIRNCTVELHIHEDQLKVGSVPDVIVSMPNEGFDSGICKIKGRKW